MRLDSSRTPLNQVFASSLKPTIERYDEPALWIHGHMHDPVDVNIGATRVLRNPAGYDANKNRGSDPQLCIKIPRAG